MESHCIPEKRQEVYNVFGWCDVIGMQKNKEKKIGICTIFCTFGTN